MPQSRGPGRIDDYNRVTEDVHTRERLNAESATRCRRLVAVAALLMSGVFLYASWNLDVGTSAEPGPGLVPRLAAAGLGLSAVLAFFSRVEPSAEVEGAPDLPGGRRQVVVLCTLTAYVVALPFLGFLLSSLLTLSICSWRISATGSVKRAALIGTVVALTVDLGFRLLLSVDLPSGLWDIRTV